MYICVSNPSCNAKKFDLNAIYDLTQTDASDNCDIMISGV